MKKLYDRFYRMCLLLFQQYKIFFQLPDIFNFTGFCPILIHEFENRFRK